MTVTGDNIRGLRKRAKLTQAQLAERLNVSQRTVASWEMGDRTPPTDTLIAVANVFGVKLETLIGSTQTAAADDYPPTLIPINRMKHHFIPVLGSVAAGVPLYMETNYDVYVDSVRDADFALRVEGDSMVPSYLDGDMIYIKSVPDVDDGTVCVVAIDDFCTLKHLYHIEGGVQLVSENPKYPPMTYTGDNCDNMRVLGIPVGFTRLFKPAR